MRGLGVLDTVAAKGFFCKTRQYLGTRAFGALCMAAMEANKSLDEIIKEKSKSKAGSSGKNELTADVAKRSKAQRAAKAAKARGMDVDAPAAPIVKPRKKGGASGAKAKIGAKRVGKAAGAKTAAGGSKQGRSLQQQMGKAKGTSSKPVAASQIKIVIPGTTSPAKLLPGGRGRGGGGGGGGGRGKGGVRGDGGKGARGGGGKGARGGKGGGGKGGARGGGGQAGTRGIGKQRVVIVAGGRSGGGGGTAKKTRKGGGGAPTSLSARFGA